MEYDISKLVNNIKNVLIASIKTKDKDAIFLIGKTGVGKSTMTHLLSGIEIKNENNDDDDDDSDIRLVAKSAIEGFDIGHDEKS